MHKLGIALYKGNGVVDKLIKIWTRSKYSHVEFLFDTNVMFSSSPSEGTRFVYDHNTDEYDIYYIDVTEIQNESLYSYCIQENNCKYDWLGLVLSQIVSFNRESKTKWFCSEFVNSGLLKIGEFPQTGLNSCRFSPEDIYNFIKIKGVLHVKMGQ